MGSKFSLLIVGLKSSLRMVHFWICSSEALHKLCKILSSYFHPGYSISILTCMLISMHTFCIFKFFFLSIQFFVGWLLDDGKIYFYFVFQWYSSKFLEGDSFWSFCIYQYDFELWNLLDQEKIEAMCNTWMV